MRDEDMDINTMITSFSTALTDSASGYFGRNVAGTSHGSSKMFSTSVMRGEIWRRSGMKKKEQKSTGKQTRIKTKTFFLFFSTSGPKLLFCLFLSHLTGPDTVLPNQKSKMWLNFSPTAFIWKVSWTLNKIQDRNLQVFLRWWVIADSLFRKIKLAPLQNKYVALLPDVGFIFGQFMKYYY